MNEFIFYFILGKLTHPSWDFIRSVHRKKSLQIKKITASAYGKGVQDIVLGFKLFLYSRFTRLFRIRAVIGRVKKTLSTRSGKTVTKKNKIIKKLLLLECYITAEMIMNHSVDLCGAFRDIRLAFNIKLRYGTLQGKLTICFNSLSYKII